MRILLAVDGSAGADTARALVTGLSWPAGSRIEAVRVVEPVTSVVGSPGFAFVGSMEDVLGVDEARRTLHVEVAGMARDGLTVSTRVLVGRPATVLVAHAHESGADLLVMGSRGRGPIASMVLGSVSAEVATDAPCPVLVVRTATVRRVIVALDGTTEADRVVEEVAASVFLRDAHLHIVSVAPSVIPGPGILMGGGFGSSVGVYEDAVAAARRDLEQRAAIAAAHLAGEGLDVTWSVPEGDAAETLIDTAVRGKADLIVVGTHGRTGLTRLVVGSVARDVLLHAHTSVLVLHEPHAAKPEEQATRPTAGVA